jgi:hypothetical protein
MNQKELWQARKYNNKIFKTKMKSIDGEVFTCKLNGAWSNGSTRGCYYLVMYFVASLIGFAIKGPGLFFVILGVVIGGVSIEKGYYGGGRCFAEISSVGVRRLLKGNITYFGICDDENVSLMWEDIRYVGVIKKEYLETVKQNRQYNFIEFPIYIICSRYIINDEQMKDVRKYMLGEYYVCIPYSKKALDEIKKYYNGTILYDEGIETKMILQNHNFNDTKKFNFTFEKKYTSIF